MIVSINQPAYLPWLGYFDRIAKSDLHVVLDHVQFEKNSFTNRNRIRTKTGSAWLTVPLLTSGRFGNLAIDSVEIDARQPWARKHMQALRSSYSRAPHFEEHAAFMEEVYTGDWPRLLPFAWKITEYLLQAFGIERKIVFSSSLSIEGKKDELVVNICRALGASTYLSGPLGKDYLNEKAFHDHGIKLAYHNYSHPQYRQAFPGFESHMAAVDLLFNLGADSLKILSGSPQVEVRA